jgi:hypothetical protein
MRNERRKKRTRKANSTSMRDLQAREGEHDLQAETKPMPQLKSEAVAETNTANRQGPTKIKEATMKDKLNLDKAAVVRILMAVGISVGIIAILFLTLGVPKATYDADMTRMEQGMTTMGSKIADNTADITDLASDVATTTAQYGNITSTVSQQALSINLLQSKVGVVESDITTIEGELATVGSPPEGYLTGNFTSSNLTLHARASDAGNYTTNVHLVFTPLISVGNATTQDEALTTFYGSVNWTAANVKAYVPVISYNGTDWGIIQVWWNIGTFALAADNTTDVSVLYGGLNSTPSFAYVEIYPAFK